MLYVLQSNRNYNKIFTIDRDRMLYLQFCIPYRKNYEYNMSRGIIWMYYAHMSLRLLLHYGMEILLEYMYIVIHMYIIRIYIFSFYYSHFYRLTIYARLNVSFRILFKITNRVSCRIRWYYLRLLLIFLYFVTLERYFLIR